MKTDRLQFIEVNPGQPVSRTVIWLHGLGADGRDFEPVVPELGLPAEWGVRFVFPHAPYRPVTINGGYVMRAWYDVRSQEIDRLADLEGIRASAAAVSLLVEQEIASGLPASDIVLAGFSQGGVIALEVGARFRQPLGGVVALSTYLSDAPTFPVATSSSPPVFMAHGRQDDIVPFVLGVRSRQELEGKGYRVTWRDYAMPHSVCAEEVNDIGGWLREVLNPAA
jgi:phospholipase/carboxylesterase